jgi:hypothetical protein
MADITRAVKLDATGASGILANDSVKRVSSSKSGCAPKAARSASVNDRRQSVSRQFERLLSIVHFKNHCQRKVAAIPVK